MWLTSWVCIYSKGPRENNQVWEVCFWEWSEEAWNTEEVWSHTRTEHLEAETDRRADRTTETTQNKVDMWNILWCQNVFFPKHSALLHVSLTGSTLWRWRRRNTKSTRTFCWKHWIIFLAVSPNLPLLISSEFVIHLMMEQTAQSFLVSSDSGYESSVIAIIQRHEVLSATHQKLQQRLARMEEELEQGKQQLQTMKQENSIRKLVRDTKI